MKYILTWAAGLLLCSALMAQSPELRLLWDVEAGSGASYTLTAWLETTDAEARAVGAANLSVLLPAGCEVVAHQSRLHTTWTEYLERDQVLALDAASRWQYGNADPGLPETSLLEVPAEGGALQVLRLELAGACAAVEVEDEAANPLNQFGDAAMQPVPYEVQRRGAATVETLAEGLTLKVFPNPTPDVARLRFEGAREAELKLALYAVDGRRIWEATLAPEASGSLAIDLSEEAAGVYLLQIEGEAAMKPVRIVKR